MYVLACIPIYVDCGRDLCCDPAGSQESAPELGVGYEVAIKNAPLPGSLNSGRPFGTYRTPGLDLSIATKICLRCWQSQKALLVGRIFPWSLNLYRRTSRA